MAIQSSDYHTPSVGMNRSECHTEAMRLLGHAFQTGRWHDLPERLSDLRRRMGYMPIVINKQLEQGETHG